MSALQTVTEIAAQRIEVADAHERRRIMLIAQGEASCGSLECDRCEYCTEHSQELPYGRISRALKKIGGDA